MSTCYKVEVTVYGAYSNRFTEIAAAVRERWGFTDAVTDSTDGYLYFKDHLGHTGVSPKKLARTLARDIWTANQAYCKVEIQVVLVEQTPTESFEFYEEDYQEQMKKPAEGSPSA